MGAVVSSKLVAMLLPLVLGQIDRLDSSDTVTMIALANNWTAAVLEANLDECEAIARAIVDSGASEEVSKLLRKVYDKCNPVAEY